MTYFDVEQSGSGLSGVWQTAPTLVVQQNQQVTEPVDWSTLTMRSQPGVLHLSSLRFWSYLLIGSNYYTVNIEKVQVT
jgi:hypothetical protein